MTSTLLSAPALDTLGPCVCLNIARVMLGRRQHDPGKVRRRASVMLNPDRPFLVSLGFLNTLAPGARRGARKFGAGDELVQDALSADELAPILTEYLVSRLARDRRVCEAVRREAIKFALNSNTNPDVYVDKSSFLWYVRFQSERVGEGRLRCGCRVCLWNGPPGGGQPIGQTFLRGLERLHPGFRRRLSGAEERLAAELVLEWLDEEDTEPGRSPSWTLDALTEYFGLLNEAARLTSEAALCLHRGAFAEQAEVEHELASVLTRLPYSSAGFAWGEYKALKRLQAQAPPNWRNMLAGYAVRPSVELGKYYDFLMDIPF